MQVAFFDIVSYSKRKSTAQRRIIEKFTHTLEQCLTEVSRQYVGYAQATGTNFSSDIVRIPTGDGAALVFTFDGLHNISLDAASAFIRLLDATNKANPCAKFEADDWCNCHDNMRVRIGMAEGKGIIYEDINGNANVAGTTINMAARVMGLAAPMQTVFTEEAYKSIIDMTTDVSIENNFIEVDDVVIKHGKKIKVFVYRDDSVSGLNSALSDSVIMSQRRMRALQMAGLSGIMEKVDGSEENEKKVNEAMCTYLEAIAPILGQFAGPEGLRPMVKIIAAERDKDWDNDGRGEVQSFPNR
jgi:class 3 adenylate cyclase